EHAEEKGSDEPRIGRVARRAPDHELLAGAAADLHPLARAPPGVRSARELRDDPLEAPLARGGVERAAAPPDVLAVAQGASGALQDPLEGLLALDEGDRAEVPAVEMEEVQGVVAERVRVAP